MSKCDNPEVEHPGFPCNHPEEPELGIYTQKVPFGIYDVDNSVVQIEGRRNGFIYITFLDGRNSGISCKVPESWVSERKDNATS